MSKERLKIVYLQFLETPLYKIKHEKKNRELTMNTKTVLQITEPKVSYMTTSWEDS